MQLGTIARTQGQRGKTAQPSISHSGQGLEGKKSSSLPVEGGIFSLTFPFIDQAISLRTRSFFTRCPSLPTLLEESAHLLEPKPSARISYQYPRERGPP